MGYSHVLAPKFLRTLFSRSLVFRTVDILLQLRHEAANVVVVAIETLTPDKVMIIFFHW
jgi:hypothetical protein